jgi:hypothetical protein
VTKEGARWMIDAGEGGQIALTPAQAK